MTQHLEDQHQHALFSWARTHRVRGPGITDPACLADYLVAIPNGGYRNGLEAARLVGLGVKPGVSDVLLPLPRHGYHGLWIEMKRPISSFRRPADARAAFSDKQRAWQGRMAHVGFAVAVCYGWTQARELIEAYLGMDGVLIESRIKVLHLQLGHEAAHA